MKRKNGIRIVLLAVFCSSVLLVSGCGSLSLFSSRHVHYHASDGADKKIDALETRVQALENKMENK